MLRSILLGIATVLLISQPAFAERPVAAAQTKKPAKAATPAKPAKAVTPAITVKAATPVKPAKTATPVIPAKVTSPASVPKPVSTSVKPAPTTTSTLADVSTVTPTPPPGTAFSPASSATIVLPGPRSSTTATRVPIVSNSPTPSPFDGYSETYYECIVPDYPNFFGGDGGYYGSPGDGGYTRNCDPEELGLLAEMDDAGLPIELAVKMNATEATANIFFEVIFVDPPPAPGAAAVNLSLAKGEEQLQQVRKIANTTPKPRVKIKNNLDVPIQIDGGVTLRRAGETSGEIELSTLTKVALFKEVNVFGTITKIPLGTVLRHTINVKGVP